MKAKLPRKQKKQFIKKYGREDYYEACWLSRFSSNVDSAIGIRGVGVFGRSNYGRNTLLCMRIYGKRRNF